VNRTFRKIRRCSPSHRRPFEISLLRREVSHDFIASTLQIKHGKKKRELKHYWYHTWPDHDVPREPSGATYTHGLLQLVAKVAKECPADRPVVVHCSAGVGRTGTFLTVHHAQELLRARGMANPLEVVQKLRTQRPAMVQHLSQFFFVHDCVTDWAEDSGKPYTVQEAAALDAMEQEHEDDEKLCAPDADHHAIRVAEKEAARVRRDTREKQLKSGTARVHKPAASHASGELHVAPIVYHGKTYEFNDVNGDGQVDWDEARANGWSRAFFDEVAQGSDMVTVAKFTEARAKAKAAELAERLRSKNRPELTRHPEIGEAWYSGELTMPTAVDWVKGTPRGSFLIRRSVSDPAKFHCLVSIRNETGQCRVGRYELVLKDDGRYHLSRKVYKTLKDFVKEATKTVVLKDAEGALKLTTPIRRETRERRRSVVR